MRLIPDRKLCSGANGIAALAFVNTLAAAAAAVLTLCRWRPVHSRSARLQRHRSQSPLHRLSAMLTRRCVDHRSRAGLRRPLWGTGGLKQMLGSQTTRWTRFVCDGVWHQALVDRYSNPPHRVAQASRRDWFLGDRHLGLPTTPSRHQVLVRSAAGVTVVWSAIVSVVSYFNCRQDHRPARK